MDHKRQPSASRIAGFFVNYLGSSSTEGIGMYGQAIVGALIGWKRAPSEHGIVISFRLMTPEAAAQDGEFDRVSLALNDRQLRSLARDLQRAAAERGIRLWAASRWQRFLRWK